MLMCINCCVCSAVDFPSYVSASARDLIKRLLDVNEKTRLGAGDEGDEDIKAHPFFKGVDWVELELRHVEPPVAPLDYLGKGFIMTMITLLLTAVASVIVMVRFGERDSLYWTSGSVG